MKFGLSVPQFEDFGDVRRLADLASDAESAGWDGFFVYGVTPGDDLGRAAAQVAPYQEVGVTGWVEGISPYDYGWGWGDDWTQEIVEKLERRVRQGPPRVSE